MPYFSINDNEGVPVTSSFWSPEKAFTSIESYNFGKFCYEFEWIDGIYPLAGYRNGLNYTHVYRFPPNNFVRYQHHELPIYIQNSYDDILQKNKRYMVCLSIPDKTFSFFLEDSKKLSIKFDLAPKSNWSAVLASGSWSGSATLKGYFHYKNFQFKLPYGYTDFALTYREETDDYYEKSFGFIFEVLIPFVYDTLDS